MHDVASQAFPFAACNIEKWVWPGDEAMVLLSMLTQGSEQATEWRAAADSEYKLSMENDTLEL